MHDIAEGRKTPRPETARRIEQATNGEVSMEELLHIPELRSQPDEDPDLAAGAEE